MAPQHEPSFGESEQARPDLRRLRDQFALRTELGDRTHGAVGATVAALRGIDLESVAAFAARVGVTPDEVQQAEAGWIPVEELPETLAFLVRRFDQG